MSPLVGALLLAASPVPAVSYQRAIDLEELGRARVTVDAAIYEHSRPDLADLRIEDAAGKLVPFLLVRGAGEDGASLEAKILNRVFEKRKLLAATLDFEQRTPKDVLELRTSGGSFRRRVSVEGSDDGSTWRSLVEGAYIFAVPGPPAARFETVALPLNDFPFLRVTIENDRDDPEVLDLLGARVHNARPARERLASSTFGVERDAAKEETRVLLDLGRDHQPFVAVEIDVTNTRFFRAVVVEASEPAGSAGTFLTIEHAGVYRYGTGAAAREALRVPAVGRAGTVRLRILDGDDSPLDVVGARVFAPEDTIVFEPPGAGRYVLSYGFPAREKPVFDLEKVVTDPVAWARDATSTSLGPEQTRDQSARRAWTERYPALLWGGLVAAVLALGLLTLRALRHAGPGQE